MRAKATETMIDFKLRGGRVKINRVILPCLTASRLVVMMGMWKLSRNGAAGVKFGVHPFYKDLEVGPRQCVKLRWCQNVHLSCSISSSDDPTEACLEPLDDFLIGLAQSIGW